MNGFPTLLFPVPQAIFPVALAVADVIGLSGLFAKPQWGIYQDGQIAIQADSVLDLTFRADAKISTYPQQEGQFASYNKVQVPFEVRLKLLKGGSIEARTEFLIALEEAKQSLELYSFIMPEASYDNVNIFHYDLHRTSKQGVTLLTVEVWGEQIISTAQESSSTITNAKAPGSNDPVDGGTVAPTTYSGPIPVAQ